ncbi:MAG: ATP-binding protein, partial [Treponema pedis]|uniref:ATP-binding protein n=1 Tax=Treponema pedis TaxID=409322 RepID=UPI003133D04C
AYFLGQKELFKDLVIEHLEEAEKEKREIWREYPVFYLDFNVGKYDSIEALNINLNIFLSDLEKDYGFEEKEENFAKRFEGLLKRAYEKTGKQVVFLVDEYDKPLLQTMGKNEALNEEYRSTLKAFYSVLKSSDQYVRFAFLTGVTKFSKVSIFSDLNNLRDISMEEAYGTVCGITQTELEHTFAPEIKVLEEKYSSTHEAMLAKLKAKYDGYLFHPDSEKVYNPFSIINAFAKKELKNYWFATGTPTFLVDYLKEAYYNIPNLDGKVELNESGLELYRAAAKEPLPILFQAGYLTIKDYSAEARLYRLGFPNDEVRYGFLENLIPAYTGLRLSDTGVSIWEFTKAVRAGDVDDFMERMKAIISGIPYDSLSKKDAKLREQNYQAAVYLVFALMGQFVETEVHCATGRADCIVQTETAVYIFEFKLGSKGSAEDAIAQIKEKNYAGKYAACGKPITLIGASFDGRKRTIKNWKTAAYYV